MRDELLKEILDELRKLNSSNETAQEKVEQHTQQIQSGVSGLNMWQASSKIAGIAGNAAGAINSGDIRNVGVAGATAVGAALGGPAGAAAGATLGQAASEIAGLFAPRGYNAFNMFEKHDKTVTDPYKRSEDMYAMYARYGMDLPKEEVQKWYSEDKKLSNREYAARERHRKWFGDETSISSGIQRQASSLMSGLNIAVDSGTSFYNDGGQAQFGDGMDKTVSIAKKQQRNVKSVMRQDRFDDDY